MIELKPDLELPRDLASNLAAASFHHSFYAVSAKLKKWLERFPHSFDNSVFTDLFLLYLLGTKKFFDHRSPEHLFRLVLNLHLMQKKLLHTANFFPQQRHLEIRWLSTALVFPFSSKPVLGCLVGFNVLDRHEVFDEENVILSLQKHHPQLRMVKESAYCHTSQHKNLKVVYLEVDNSDGTLFSIQEQRDLRAALEDKFKNSIQTLTPTIFMGPNEEEIYKNILVLSQEIRTLQDHPQAHITLAQQSGKDIVFRVIMVHIAPFHRFSLKECFFDTTFISERVLTVRHLENHPIEANIFCLHLPRDASLLRSDGSLDFYAARQKVAALIKTAIGDFRDYNGGIIIKQQELLVSFKEQFPEVASKNPELMEEFFYALTPLEKQVILPIHTLSTLFSYFLENRKQKLPKGTSFAFNYYQNDRLIYLHIHGENPQLIEAISSVLQDHTHRGQDIAYCIINDSAGLFFNCVFLQEDSRTAERLIQALRYSLDEWQKKMNDRQVLRVGLEYSFVSLDPRIGGEAVSGDIIRLLFEGLTRYSQNGGIENGVSDSIKISSNSKQYIFKLRSCLWNDGSYVTAYDFEYAWKKILSPDFKTSFSYLFYPIKNARQAKEGKVPSSEIGITVIDEKTLKVDLEYPTPCFLQLTAHPLYSPIHQAIDKKTPEWPYQCEQNYPCNGPFQLKANKPNQGYQLVKNPFYWDANSISLDQITMTMMNPAQAVAAFQKNEVDWVGNPFGGWHSFFSPRKEDKILSFSNSWVCWLVFNTGFQPFQHRKMRQAIAYAIQRAEIIKDACLCLNPAYSVLLPYFKENSHSLFPEHDLEKARQLFHEALRELGLQKEQLPSFSIIFNEKGLQKYTAQIIKQQLKECLGIDCELKSLPWTALFSKMTEGSYQMGLMHWTSWVDDPTYTLNAFRSNKLEINFAKWENSVYQRLMDLSELEVNPFQRSSHLLKAEEVLCQEAPVIPLYYQPYQALVHRDLYVSYKSPCGPFNIARSSFKK